MNGPHVAPIGSAPDDSLPTPGPEARRPRVFLLIVVVAVALLVALLYWRAHARLNQVPLADAELLLINAQLDQAVGQFAVARARAVLGRVMGDSAPVLQKARPL